MAVLELLAGAVRAWVVAAGNGRLVDWLSRIADGFSRRSAAGKPVRMDVVGGGGDQVRVLRGVDISRSYGFDSSLPWPLWCRKQTLFVVAAKSEACQNGPKAACAYVPRCAGRAGVTAYAELTFLISHLVGVNQRSICRNGRALMESATFRKWLRVRLCLAPKLDFLASRGRRRALFDGSHLSSLAEPAFPERDLACLRASRRGLSLHGGP
jgi:hypothetical protein